jgi:hypothetical protein
MPGVRPCERADSLVRERAKLPRQVHHDIAVRRQLGEAALELIQRD